MASLVSRSLRGVRLQPDASLAPRLDRLLYGVAYYDEYIPADRLEQGVRMMKEAGINVVRIAESPVSKDSEQQLAPWGVMIVLEN